MIKTLKQTTKEIYYWIKDKVVRFKKWLIVLIFGATILAAPIIIPSVPDIALENIQADYHASELKDKYRLEKTAFILDAIDENAIQAEVGNKNSDSFEPSLTLRKWSDEVNFKVKYKHGEKEKDQKVDIENKKIKWKGKKTEVHYYEMKKGEVLLGEELEHDVFEVEVLLLEKPDTNVVEFDIETTGLAFYYQPELTQEEIDEGAERPENVIGSYAVYHESKQGDYSKMGLKNYRAGKAFHIYRPKIIDSAGKEVWGELNITDNLLTVEIPQSFLDTAVYPVRHAAGLTLGYTTAGGSSTGEGDTAYGSQLNVVASTDGNVDNVSFYGYGKDGDENVKGFVTDSNLNILTNGITPSITNYPWPKAWRTLNYSTKPTVINGNTYYPFIIFDDTYTYLSYDSGTGDNSLRDETNSYASPVSPTDATNRTSKYSIYCTYQAGAADARRMFIVD